MNSDEVFVHLSLRQTAAEVILAKWAEHQVCTVCGSINKLTANVCRRCHSYRFETGADEIKLACENLASIPFPITEGTAPRLTKPEIPSIFKKHEK